MSTRRTLGLPLLVTLFVALGAVGPAAAGHAWSTPVLTIDPDSLRQLTRQGRAVLAIDVRPRELYEAGRLPGARSIPLTALTARQRELPADGLVVLYGADSVDEAAAAFRYLRSAGRTNVFVLEGGYAAWRASGYGIEY